MSLENFIKSLPSGYWVMELIQQKNDNKIPSFSKKDREKINDEIKNSMQCGRDGGATFWLALSILNNSEDTFTWVKKQGILRYSMYNDRRNTVKKVIKKILKFSIGLNLKKEEIDYLQSILNFGLASDVFIEIERDLVNVMKAMDENPRTSLIKSLLAYVDFLFLKKYRPEYHENSEDYSKEAISEAVSFLLYLYNKKIGINNKKHFWVDEKLLHNGIDSLVRVSCQYKKLQEFEILISYFSYRCTIVNGKLIIEANNPDIEKSIRIGFIRTDLQRYYLVMKEKTKSISIEQAAKFFLDKFNQLYLKKSDFGYERYVLNIPEPLLSYLFTQDRFFEEEQLYLKQLFKENFFTFDSLQRTEIKSGVSLLNLIKVKRLFSFLYYAFSLQMENETNIDLVYRSLLPSFPQSKLIEFLNQITNLNGKTILEMMTWKPEIDEVLDLQYHPFFKVSDEYYYIPLNIIHSSDIIRNVYASEYRRDNSKLYSNGDYDPLSIILDKCFKKAGFKTYNSIKYSYNGKNSEIDFLALKDGAVFIAECKNAILPTNAFELRTSYDYIIKAVQQLNQSKIALSDLAFRKEFAQNIDMDLGNVNLILTCIIIGNRVFAGANTFGHPVRYIYEISNMVESGIYRNEKGAYSMWKGKKFTIDDLTSYLNDKNGLIRSFFDSVEPFIQSYKFNNYIIEFNSYKLNLEILRSKISTQIYKRKFIFSEFFMRYILSPVNIFLTKFNCFFRKKI